MSKNFFIVRIEPVTPLSPIELFELNEVVTSANFIETDSSEFSYHFNNPNDNDRQITIHKSGKLFLYKYYQTLEYFMIEASLSIIQKLLTKVAERNINYYRGWDIITEDERSVSQISEKKEKIKILTNRLLRSDTQLNIHKPTTRTWFSFGPDFTFKIPL